MTDTASPPSPATEVHWVVAYLREDIQDLRTEIRGVHTRIDGLRNETFAQFDVLRKEVATQIGDLRNEIRGVRTRIDGLRDETSVHFGALRKEMTSRFYWTIATMVTLVGVMTAVTRM